MSTAEHAVWIHVSSGHRFELIHDCGTHGITGRTRKVVLRYARDNDAPGAPIEFPITRRLLDSLFIPEQPLDDVMALAEAFDVIAPALDGARPTGAQPVSEFRVAPFHPSVRGVLSNENLATVLDSWSTCTACHGRKSRLHGWAICPKPCEDCGGTGRIGGAR